MNFRTKLKEQLIKISGYRFIKSGNLPVGSDLVEDLNNKIQLPIKTIFDVGANNGQTVASFYNYYSDAEIYSFEPISSTFAILNENSKGKAKCYQLALGDKTESVEVKLFDSSKSNLNSLKKDVQDTITESKTETINVVTGDAFSNEHNIGEIDLLKIDTEGFELEVLSGFQSMIDQGKIKAIYCEVGFSEINERNTYLTDILSFAARNKYSFYGLYEINPERIPINKHFGNALFIHNSVLS